MIARARVHETLFRHSSGGREPLAPPREGGDHVHYQPRRSAGLGVITSRARPTHTFWELLAWELSGAGDPSRAIVPGCTVSQAKALHREGLIK